MLCFAGETHRQEKRESILKNTNTVYKNCFVTVVLHVSIKSEQGVKISSHVLIKEKDVKPDPDISLFQMQWAEHKHTLVHNRVHTTISKHVGTNTPGN